MQRIAVVNFDQLQQSIGSSNQYETLGDVLSDNILYVYALAGFLLLVYLVISGFKYMTAKGDPKALQSAKSSLATALIGFIIVFVSFWIVQLLATVLGLQPITNIF